MKGFKSLGLLLISDVKMEQEMDRQIGAVSAIMRSLYWTVVGKRELSPKAKLPIFQSIYIPTFIFGHKLWVVSERMRSQI